MSQTLVIFWVPEGQILECHLTDLALEPRVGAKYVFEDRLYEVENTIETLGLNKNGDPKSVEEQLISLLAALSAVSKEGQVQLNMLAGTQEIGSSEGEERGLRIPMKSISRGTSVRVVLLQLRLVKKALPGINQLLKAISGKQPEEGKGNPKSI